ncbi:MAG: hypothetical protein ACXWYO_04415 [Gaiellaceae bacterium]
MEGTCADALGRAADIPGPERLGVLREQFAIEYRRLHEVADDTVGGWDLDRASGALGMAAGVVEFTRTLVTAGSGIGMGILERLGSSETPHRCERAWLATT